MLGKYRFLEILMKYVKEKISSSVQDHVSWNFDLIGKLTFNRYQSFKIKKNSIGGYMLRKIFLGLAIISTCFLVAENTTKINTFDGGGGARDPHHHYDKWTVCHNTIDRVCDSVAY